MKIKQLLTIIPLFLAVTMHSQENSQENQERLTRAKCKVKTVTTMHTDYKDYGKGPKAGTPYLTSKSTCNKAGFFTVSKTFTKTGVIESWNGYEYEKDANPKMMIVYNGDGTVNVRAEIRNGYDSLGRHISTSTFVSDTIFLGKTLYSYDDKGYLVKANTYEALAHDRSQMRLTYSERYKYDDKGRISELTSHSEGSSNDFTTTFKYGADGRVAEKKDNYSAVYKYGANGLCSSITHYKGNDEIAYVVNYTYEFYAK
ncbi:MAG TPA: hypothetical protein VF868_03255 [Bacteroidia bacterium]|jgi:hypothetical protein